MNEMKGSPPGSTPEQIWRQYEKGVAYNAQLDLYETIKQNENFFIGKQWEGVNAPDLEKPVLNFLKRVVTYFISQIVSDDIGVSLAPFSGDEQLSKALAGEVERVIERTRMKTLNREMLRNCAVDGDGCFYCYFDPQADSGQLVQGEIVIENIDNTNLLFGNPYEREVQRQPYLILVKRMQLDAVRRLAVQLGTADPDLIQADASGAQYYGEQNAASDELVTVLTKLYRLDGGIRSVQSTRDLILKPDTDTGLTRYPVAYMNWEAIKNSYHGQAAITGLIPNQIFVNKLWAMAMEHQKKMAFPKLFYDVTKIAKWSNKVGQAIAVTGNPNEAIAGNFRAADMSGQVLELVDRTINYTRDFMGASDAALGNIKPDNTSAIIAVQKASSAPLELQRLAFYQFVEDVVRILLDLMRACYGVRQVEWEAGEGQRLSMPIDFSSIRPEQLDLNVEVGAASYWSELTQIQTLSNLWSSGIVTDAITYLEGIPDQYLNNKQKIIDKLKEQQALTLGQGMPGASPAGAGEMGYTPELQAQQAAQQFGAQNQPMPELALAERSPGTLAALLRMQGGV